MPSATCLASSTISCSTSQAPVSLLLRNPLPASLGRTLAALPWHNRRQHRPSKTCADLHRSKTLTLPLPAHRLRLMRQRNAERSEKRSKTGAARTAREGGTRHLRVSALIVRQAQSKHRAGHGELSTVQAVTLRRCLGTSVLVSRLRDGDQRSAAVPAQARLSAVSRASAAAEGLRTQGRGGAAAAAAGVGGREVAACTARRRLAAGDAPCQPSSTREDVIQRSIHGWLRCMLQISRGSVSLARSLDVHSLMLLSIWIWGSHRGITSVG